jgi:hypothetical protein
MFYNAGWLFSVQSFLSHHDATLGQFNKTFLAQVTIWHNTLVWHGTTVYNSELSCTHLTPMLQGVGWGAYHGSVP